MMTAEYSQTSRKISHGRGMAKASLDLIGTMRDIAEACNPITGRGVGYKLFAQGLIDGMDTNTMQKVYRLLVIAREQQKIPWEWIVDETRYLEKKPTWDDPAHFVEGVRRSYRRDFWNDQPRRLEVWSEKGTVRGVLAPVLDRYGVGFRVLHGFSGATTVHDVAEDYDGRKLTILYVGDYDPSGMNMSEHDLPKRFQEYGGEHVELIRVALTKNDCTHIGKRYGFSVDAKTKDPRYKWFVKNYGKWCWELDAMDPRDLRARVRQRIWSRIEKKAWKRCETINKAEVESLQTVLDSWNALKNPE